MKKNIPRFLALLLLLCGLAGGPVAARLGRSVPPGVLRWLVTAGAAMMIISFFWFPRRGANPVPQRRAAARPKRTAAKVERSMPIPAEPREKPIGRRARKLSQAPEVKRSKRRVREPRQ